MQSSIRRIVHAYHGSPAVSEKLLRELYEGNTAAFLAASISIIKENINAPGLQCVSALLLANEIILRWLCDPELFTKEEATRLVGILRRVDPSIDLRLISEAFPAAGAAAEVTLDEDARLRILEIATAGTDALRSPLMVAQLLRDSSPKVRSKAALIVGRGDKNPKLVHVQVRRIVHTFHGDAAASAKQLRELYESNTAAFLDASISIVKEKIDTPGLQYLVTLLLGNGVILRWLCDPEMFTKEQATRLVAILRRIDPRIDLRLMSTAFPVAGAEPEQALNEEARLRILEITTAASEGLRSLPIVAQLLRDSSPKVRSKAALIVGRGNKNAKWVKVQMSSGDARLRANGIEALWGVDTPDSHAVLASALNDTDNRVVGNGILGLYRLGDASSIALVLKMASHQDERFRETAIWVMEQTGDVRFLGPLESMMSAHPEHRAKILRALTTLRRIAEAKSHTPHVRILVDRCDHVVETNAINLNVVALTKSGPMSNALPTQFAVWRDSVLVEDYEVESVAFRNPSAVAFVVPRSLLRPSLELLVHALRFALRYRRPEDVWSVVKYRSERPPADVAGAGRESAQHLSPVADHSDPLMKEICFSDDNDSIEDSLLKTRSVETSAASVAHAIAAGISSMPSDRPEREILVLLDQLSADLPPSGVTELVSLAQKNRTAIHIISPQLSELGRRLAIETGGQHIAPCLPKQFGEVLEVFTAVRAGGFQLRFRCESVKPASVQVQFYTNEAEGKAVYKM